MHTFAQKTKATQQTMFAKSTIPGRAHIGQSPDVRAILHLQRTIGNRAVQRLLQARPDGLEAISSSKELTRFADDFNQKPVHAKSPASAQAKLAVSSPRDTYEQEADRVAAEVMRMPEPTVQRASACAGGCPKYQTEQPHPEPEAVETESTQSSNVGNPTAPPIVHEVLRSPGQPLEPTARDFMEPRFGYDFSQIRIHTDPDAAKASAALGAEAFTFGRHIAFARERFLPGMAHGKRLLAHELTHAIQQAAAFPHIALQPNKTRPARTPGRSGVVGGLLGWNHSNAQVRVKSEVGGTQGYDDRLQAIAVARLAKAEPAAVVQDITKKWHAVEITADFEAGPDRTASAALEASAEEDSPFLAVYGLPSLTLIEQSRQKVRDLDAKLAELKARKTTSEDERKAVDLESDQVRADLTKAHLTRVRAILGVPESDIEFTSSLSGRKSGKINIIGLPEKGSPGGGHAPMGGETTFEEGRDSAFWIDFPEVDKPRAAETMFHEVSHLRDWEFAQEWIRKYTTETKRLFVKSATAPLQNWLNDQVKKGRLTKADVEMVIMEAADATAYTEASANVRSFLADLQAGAPDLATKALVGYAHALKPKSEGGGGQYANPASKSEVEAALVAELKKAYRQMPKNMQQQYDAAVAAAKKENPSAWISQLDFSKSAGK
jgi:hypothetical protein